MTVVGVIVVAALMVGGIVWYRLSRSGSNAAATALSGQNGDQNSAGTNAPAAPKPINASPATTLDYVKG